MFFRSLRKRLFLLPLIALLAATGCRGNSGDDEYRDEQTLKLLNQGKDLLGKNQWGQSKEVFQRVLDQYDNANSEARFGIVLADLLSFSDTIRLVSSLTDSFSSSASSEENKFVNQLITDLIHDLRAKFVTIDQNLLLVEANPGFVFKIKSLPVYLSDSEKPSVELNGEWDRADAFLLNAAIKAVLGTLNYADSVDLNLDVLRAYDYFSQSGFDSNKMKDIESVVTYILNDPNYPNFLSVKKDGGNELAIQAGKDYAAAVHDFQIALYMVSLETDNQSDDMFQYVDANENHKYDPAINPDSDKCAALASKMAAGDVEHMPENFKVGDSIIGGSKQLPYLSEQTACLLQKAYHNLDWDELKDTQTFYTERPRINVLGDIIPLVDSLVSSIAKSNPKLLPIPISPGIISDLADQFLGNTIELDPYAFFNPDDSGKAGNFRGLLPIWQNNPCPSTGLCYNDFVLEMECSSAAITEPVAMTTLFTELELPACKKAWDKAGFVLDSEHFKAETARLDDFNQAPTDKDGFIGYLPYIAFQDASIHGLLWMNLAAMGKLYDANDAEEGPIAAGLKNLDASASDFQPATSTDLNAFIAALSANGTIKGLIVK